MIIAFFSFLNLTLHILLFLHRLQSTLQNRRVSLSLDLVLEKAIVKKKSYRPLACWLFQR